MARDQIVQRAFEIADDAMQSTIGYFHYCLARHATGNDNQTLDSLRHTPLQITFGWDRSFPPEVLNEVMRRYFEPFLSRMALISVVSSFETALRKIHSHLSDCALVPKLKSINYGPRLEWAFREMERWEGGDDDMLQRLPDICRLVDNARRLRNLWIHDNGVFTEKYRSQAIRCFDGDPIIDGAYSLGTPVILDKDSFLGNACCHIELIHQVHNAVQMKFFGHLELYSYEIEGKPLVLNRLFLGV